MPAEANGDWHVVGKAPLDYSLEVSGAHRAHIYLCLQLETPLAERQVVCTFEVVDARGEEIPLPNLTKSPTLNKHYIYLSAGLGNLEIEHVVQDLPPAAATLRIGLLEWTPKTTVKAPSLLPAVLDRVHRSADGPFVPITFMKLAR
jgi:hypothetical protein